MATSSRGPRGSSKHRPGFHALVLVVGYMAGGAVQAILRLVLPSGRTKDFLTAGVSTSIGPLPINLVLLNFSLGPVIVEVSLLAVLGVIAT